MDVIRLTLLQLGMDLRGFQTRLGILLGLITEPLKKLLNIFYNCFFFLIWDKNIPANQRYSYEIRSYSVYGQFVPLLL